VPSTAIPYPSDLFVVMPWVDPLVDAVGLDPRSPYVEQFWLGVLGPSTTFLMRRLAAGFDAYPDGFELDLADTAAALGLTVLGPQGPFARAISRCVQFGLAQPHSHGLLVRRRVPPLSHRHVARLSPSLQAAHERWVELELAAATADRARRLAGSLVAAGEPAHTVERDLQLVGVPPRLAGEAVVWALGRAAA
jgi:hypothetical protein